MSEHHRNADELPETVTGPGDGAVTVRGARSGTYLPC